MKRKCAALTISGNEPDFMGMWYDYYSQHFDNRDIYVLDNESKPPINLPVNIDVIGTGQGYIDDIHIRHNLEHKFGQLLKDYHYVLAHDVDMFVVPNPEKYPDGLREFIDRFNKVFVQCSGYNVLGPGLAIDVANKPWLMQREYWHREWRHLCKVVLASESPEWGIGTHHSKWNREYRSGGLNEHENVDLRLLHLGWCCETLLRRRWLARKVSSVNQRKDWDPAIADKVVKAIANDTTFNKQRIPDVWRQAI